MKKNNVFCAENCTDQLKMATRLNKKKRELAELCIAGFLREYCSSNETPQELEQLIVLMYFIMMDEWNIKIAKETNQMLEFDAENQIVSSDAYRNWYRAFGSMTIKKVEINTWKFKMLTQNPDTMIGIVDTEMSKSKSIFQTDIGYSFAYDSRFGLKTGLNCGMIGEVYAQKCNQDDVITMILDMTGDEFATLSFKINDKEFGNAFDQIDMNRTYNMAVRIFNASKIQLLVT